jgi:histidinol phosphatase-like PHP family hydrolase
VPYFDFHIHSKYSRCCKGKYTYKDIWERIQECHLDGFGVSDHSHNKVYRKPEIFIPEYKKAQKELKLEKTGLVGLEVSIFNLKGDLGIHPRVIKLLDYLLISEHVHKAKPFTGIFRTKAKVKHWLKSFPEKEDKLLKEFDKVIDMQILSLEKNKHSIEGQKILAHIYKFVAGVGYLPQRIFERLDEVLAVLQSTDTALEIHKSHFSDYYLSDDEAQKRLIAGENTRKDFIHYLYKRSKQFSLTYALGSDAHRLEEIKTKEEWMNFLQDLNISENQLVNPNTFR